MNITSTGTLEKQNNGKRKKMNT